MGGWRRSVQNIPFDCRSVIGRGYNNGYGLFAYMALERPYNTAMLLTNKFTLSLMLDGLRKTLRASTKFFSCHEPRGKSYSMRRAVLFVLPMLLFYMIVQKGFIESIDRLV